MRIIPRHRHSTILISALIFTSASFASPAVQALFCRFGGYLGFRTSVDTAILSTASRESGAGRSLPSDQSS